MTSFTRFVSCLLTVVAATLPARSQSAHKQVAGNWVGILDTVHADGSVDPGNAYFTFTQQGDVLTGSAGDSPAHLSPLANGKQTGNLVTFDVIANPHLTVAFHLELEGDQLTGTASGLPIEPGGKLVVKATRADASGSPASATEHIPDRLFATVAELDRKLFDAYNTCDLKTLSDLVTEDLEFYHDKTGLAVGRPVFIESIRNNICGKVHRTLLPGTLEVHRLNQYGAVEIGAHRFTHPGHTEDGVGEAKFITIWRLKDGDWKVTRVISYDHAPAKP